MTDLPRPRAILFDLFHTLVSIPVPGGVFGPTLAAALGIPDQHEEVGRRYYEDDVLERCIGKTRDPHEIMRAVAHAIDPTVTEAAISDAVAVRQRRFRHGLVEIEPAILAALDRVRAAGIRTALVSDAGWDDIEYWHESPLRSRLDAIVFSCEVGVRKPAAAIYQHALDRLGVSASDAIFVGDGGSDEHRGARALGIRSVLVTRLFEVWIPERMPARRGLADWEFEDVPAFVEKLLGQAT